MPKNASIGSSGFRIYHWAGGNGPLHHKYGATEPADLLSVTSARSLCGVPIQLVNWQINNVVTVATGSRKTEWRDYSKSTRGRRVEGYKADGPFPGEFVRRLLADGETNEGMTEVRKWLRSAAEQPRDIAAVRGSVVHKLIELNMKRGALNDDLIRVWLDRQWAEEKNKSKAPVTEEDIRFIDDAMFNYWDMRAAVPFVVLAQEPQVFNLKVGYAGSADVLLWFLPPGEDVDYWQVQASRGKVTLEVIQRVGGVVAVGDWKTSPDVYTSHVVQTVAYTAGSFVAEDGLIDERLSDILIASQKGMVIKIRPDGWEVDIFGIRQEVLMAFYGSVALARFLALHERPGELIDERIKGRAPETERTVQADD